MAEDHLTCSAVAASLGDFVDEALPPLARRGFIVHLARCEACRVRLEAIHSTLNLLRALPAENMPRERKAPLLREVARRRSA